MTKMTNLEAVTLLQGLESVKDLVGVKFGYAVSKNTQKLTVVRNALQKAGEMSEDFRKFSKEKEDLFTKHCKEDKDGKPMKVQKGQLIHYDFKDPKKVEVEFKVLQKKHEKAIKDDEVKRKELDDLLKDEITIDICKVKMEFVSEKITAGQMNSIMPMIEE